MNATAGQELDVDLGERGTVSALYLAPADATCVFALAHGAGAGMRHVFMDAVAERLAERRVATFRYQYGYIENGRKRPDHRKVLEATTRAAIAVAAEVAGDLPLLAGGKSMGGRITSQCQATEPLAGVRGLAFLGFPLHPAGKPATKRADHLRDVAIPMLFLQGTRDRLAEMQLIEPVCAGLEPARLHVVEGADHGFHVLKRSGRTDDQVLDELADQITRFAEAL